VPVVAVFQSPSLTQERYEESVRRLTGGRSRFQSPADWPVEACWPTLPEKARAASESSTCGSPRTRSVASARR
jgi:hypothetical protein